MSVVLEVQDLSCELQGRHLVDRISFTVGAGETLVLLVTVSFNGTSTSSLDPDKLRRRIGYVIQEVGLLPSPQSAWPPSSRGRHQPARLVVRGDRRPVPDVHYCRMKIVD